MARVVVVEGWLRGSHRAFATRWREQSRHDVELLSLPGVHWKWRLHGGAVDLAGQFRRLVDRSGPVHAVMTTSAIDTASFVGLARRAIGTAAVVTYLHENQVTFPRRPTEPEDLTDAVATWRSLVAADRVVFNSAHHRRELYEALPTLLRRFPDHRGLALVPEVAARSTVIGVGVERPATKGRRRPGPVRLLWNHRWEHDKDPGRYLAALRRLAATGREFELAFTGSHLPRDRVLDDLGELASRTTVAGHLDTASYHAVLADADLVVSTARHEFYGVSVAEAAAAGALPVVPDGLAYPELFPRELHAELLYRDDAGLDRLLAAGVDDRDRRAQLVERLRIHSAVWDAARTTQQLDDLVDEVTA